MIDKIFEHKGGNQFKLVNENISTNDLQNFINKMNKETGRNYYLGGAYGNYELWDRSASGEQRLEVGSRNDIYQYLIKNRFKKSISEQESDDGGSICSKCKGSGEGSADGTICSKCGGSGDEDSPWGQKHQEEDPDDLRDRRLDI